MRASSSIGARGRSHLPLPEARDPTSDMRRLIASTSSLCSVNNTAHVTEKAWVNRNNFQDTFGFCEMLIHSGVLRIRSPKPRTLLDG
jgi:hypothetical protein